MSTLHAATIVEPSRGDDQSDRDTYVVLGEHDQNRCFEFGRRYERWIEEYVAEHEDVLSTNERNLLRANWTEIFRYILQEVRGTDVSATMYRQFYASDLAELIEEQEEVLVAARERRSPRYGTLRKAYWRNIPLTVGVEEEYQIVSRETWDLAPGAGSLLDRAKMTEAEIGGEVYQSQIELKTPICETIVELERVLRLGRSELEAYMPPELALASAATHPFSTWNTQQATQSARTEMFMHDMQDVVRRLVTFGLHVHVGVSDREFGLQLLYAARSFLPLLLAVSTSSPFWQSRMTGLMSYRSTIFSALPRTGIPPRFADILEYRRYLRLLAKTKSFDGAGTKDPRKIWWDIRLHPVYPTVEFRIADACSTVEDATCVAALCQAIVGKLAKLAYQGVELRGQRRLITQENKWRAIRHGRRASFIDEEKGREVQCKYVALTVLDFLHDVLEELGSMHHAHHALKIIDEGTSADYQLEIYRQTRSHAEVVRWLTEVFSSSDEKSWD